mmetsp:Transcript_38720/g.81421  ORF Transcript_38720/g.81421 Transcript_38720/m.81421 type:complete len:95 (-) Transcript_38720:115-399(-)
MGDCYNVDIGIHVISNSFSLSSKQVNHRLGGRKSRGSCINASIYALTILWAFVFEFDAFGSMLCAHGKMLILSIQHTKEWNDCVLGNILMFVYH